jgi:hypothetical protein
MAWMRLSPLFLCVAALVLLATGAIGKPIQVKPAHPLITAKTVETSQIPALTEFHHRIR